MIARRPTGISEGMFLALLVATIVRSDPTVAIWAQPLGLVVAPVATTALNAGTYVAVPLGANVSVGPTELAIEATVYTYRNKQNSAFTGGMLSIGPVLHTGDLALGGFMLVPKLGFDVMHEFVDNRTGLSLLPGVDFGWQRTFGRLYLAVVMGVSAGWSFADGDAIEGPGLNPTLPTKPGPVVGVNLNLLRLGGAF